MLLTARCYTVGKYMCECASPTTTPHPHFLNETMRPVGYHSDRRLIRLAVVERTRNPLKQCAEYNMPDGASSPLRNSTQQPRITLARRTPICNPHTIYTNYQPPSKLPAYRTPLCNRNTIYTLYAPRLTIKTQTGNARSLHYQRLHCQTAISTTKPIPFLLPSIHRDEKPHSREQPRHNSGDVISHTNLPVSPKYCSHLHTGQQLQQTQMTYSQHHENCPPPHAPQATPAPLEREDTDTTHPEAKKHGSSQYKTIDPRHFIRQQLQTHERQVLQSMHIGPCAPGPRATTGNNSNGPRYRDNGLRGSGAGPSDME